MKLIKNFTVILFIFLVFFGCAKKDESGIAQSNIEAPLKPTGLTALTGSTKGEINLSWTANTENDILGYNIYGGGQGGGKLDFIASQSANNYTVTKLIPGNNYFFKITALDNSNNESEYSDEVICKAKGDNVAPAIPAGITALVVVAGKINLSWSANIEPDLAKYNVYRSTNGGASYDVVREKIGQPPETTCVIEGLDTTTYYIFRISAVDDSDNESDKGTEAVIRAQ
ncbi:MAG: fibronectin type III domain-containing protein [bacterium]|nr:fibronectin type III domain-containing protein [bacterium]